MKILLIAALFLPAAAGAAQYRDSGDYCRSIVGDSYTLIETCVRREFDAAARLQPRISRIDTNIWQYCHRIVGYSWSLMETCVEREEQAKARLGR